MELYILSNNDLSTLAILECSDYNINLDNQFTDKSTFRVNKTDGQIKDNFLVVNGLYQQFLFIIDEVEATDKEEKFVNLVCSDISNVFNRKIIQKDTDLMTSRSIEYFLAHTIDENFINSDDSFLNKSYVEVTYYESTQAKEATNAENGIYNFHTFMENCREHKNVFTDFKFEDGKLKVTIKHKEDTSVIIDTTLPEVTHYNKIYEQDITAKVSVYIRENDTVQNYYLKTDKTITTNKNDPDRAAGAIEVISVETEDLAYNEAVNVFKGNTYKHLVEFSLNKNSKLVDPTTLYICRPIIIKTPDGIYDSIISGISLQDDEYIEFKSGNIRITFIDKLKQEQENYGNKLDVTGGVIKGDLTTEGNTTINGNSYISQVNGGDVNIGLNDGTTNFHIHGGNSSQIYWKEYDYGDKFSISPTFGGTDDDNKLRIRGAVGGQGTDPDLYNLMTISGKTGNTDIRGTYSTATTTDSHINGAKGTGVVLNNTAGAGYNMLARQKSTHGVFNLGVWNDNYNLFYIADSIVSAGTNTYTSRLKLLDESGNSSFPGAISSGKHTISATSYDMLTLYRTENPYSAQIVFKNTNGVLGALGMTGAKNSKLLRWNSDQSASYEIIDSSRLTNKTSKTYTDINTNIPTNNTLAYWNGAYNSSNSSNLTYAHQGVIQCKPTNLYNNTSGSNGTITLSQTAANFTYLEITYRDQDNHRNSVRVYDPNGKTAWLSGGYINGNSTNLKVATVGINGTSITKSGYLEYYIGGGSSGNNYIYILRVDGWKQ